MEKASVRTGLVNQQLQFFCLVFLAISANFFAKGCKHLAIRLDSLCSRLTVSRFIFSRFFFPKPWKNGWTKKVYARRKCSILFLCQPMYPWFLSEKALHYRKRSRQSFWYFCIGWSSTLVKEELVFFNIHLSFSIILVCCNIYYLILK